MKYTKIHKELICQNDITCKRILFYTYLVNHILNYQDSYILVLSLTDAITKSGLKECRVKGAVNDSFKMFMQRLYDLGYFLDFSMSQLRGNYFVEIPVNKDKMFPAGNYAIITDLEIQRINDYCNRKNNIDKIDCAYLLLVLSYIRLYMLRRSSSMHNIYSKQNIKEKPEVCVLVYKYAALEIGVDRRTLSKCGDILVDIDILACNKIGHYQDNNSKWHTECVLYADKYRYNKSNHPVTSYDYRNELEAGRSFIYKKQRDKKLFDQKIN